LFAWSFRNWSQSTLNFEAFDNDHGSLLFDTLGSFVLSEPRVDANGSSGELILEGKGASQHSVLSMIVDVFYVYSLARSVQKWWQSALLVCLTFECLRTILAAEHVRTAVAVCVDKTVMQNFARAEKTGFHFSVFLLCVWLCFLDFCSFLVSCFFSP